jgi:hypothetical protein
MISFEEKNIQKNVEKFQHTQYACVLLPTLVVHMDPNNRIKKLMEVMLRTENSLKKLHNKCMTKRSKNASLVFWTKSKLTYR